LAYLKKRNVKMKQIIKKTETILERLDRKIEELAERFF
jgi:prefoldin subunit 5